MSHFYFAFGSNLSHGQMKERCPESVPVGIGTLSGYRLSFTGYSSRWNGAGLCIEEYDRASITGGLYKISQSDLERLDTYEGVPDVYRRKYISIDCDGKHIKAFTYFSSHIQYSPPSDLYLRTILTGCGDFGFMPNALSTSLIANRYPIPRLFVYGTLKRGKPAHQLVGQYCENVEPAELPHYTPRKNGKLPVIHFLKGAVCPGELLTLSHEPTVLALTDRYEGFKPTDRDASLYVRTPVLVKTHGNQTELAWTYVFNKPTPKS